VDKLQKKEALASILKGQNRRSDPDLHAHQYGATSSSAVPQARRLARNALSRRQGAGQRQRTLPKFPAAGDPENLVATDIAARAIDVEGIRMVVKATERSLDARGLRPRVGRTLSSGGSARRSPLTLISPTNGC